MPNQSWLCTNRSGLPLAPSRVSGRKLIHGPQVPLTDPIRDPVSRKRGALQAHPTQGWCRPVLVIIHEQVGFAIPIDSGARVRIIVAHLQEVDFIGDAGLAHALLLILIHEEPFYQN